MTDARPLTETELCLSSLTDEELADAAWYLGVMHARWRESRRTAERDRSEPLTVGGFTGTEGPTHAIRALDLAILREQATRGGAEPWDARQDSEGHPARRDIRFYRERLELNPDLGVIPRLNAAGVLERVCPGCHTAKPLTVAFWAWQDETLATYCRACTKPDPAAVRAALVEAEDERAAAAPAPAWTEPIELDEPEYAL